MYSFYLKLEKEEIQLPVPPTDFTLKVNNKNKIIELLNLGDINILKDPGLTDISFKILLPGQKYPFAEYPDGFKMPRYYLERFEKYKVDRKPIRLIVSREAPWKEPLFDTNMAVSLESYTIEEKAGEEGDIYVSLELKQYKDYKTKVVTIQEVKDGKTTATVKEKRPAKTPEKTYKVKKGDTLWNIAKKELNDGNKYMEIVKLNNISNPNKINIGQVLKLP
jgi:LysM repeat protein